MPSLADVEREALACTKCPLWRGRTNVVFGVGDPTSDLMLVGEGPGAQEDLQGEPFVGRSGKLLDQLVLEELGITRKGFYLCNTVKCLRYNAKVQLGDGTWELISRLVRSRYNGTVMSVDARGCLVPRRVIGWHTSPLGGRRVMRMTFRSGEQNWQGMANVELTGDHPVLTDVGYLPAQELTPAVRVATGQGLSALAKDVVCGTLLGDGHLNKNSAHLAFSHSARQLDYARFKARLLAELAPVVAERTVAAVAGGEPQYPIVQVRTRAHRALAVLRDEFYSGRKQVPVWVADRLNPRMLAFWFMDDGHLNDRPGHHPRAEIATCGFLERDLVTLVVGLERLGLPARIRAGRLHFRAAATRRLSEVIAPYVPPSMRYKLHPDVREAVPFEESALVPGPPEVLYDHVRVEDVTDRPRTDRSFYCIDVEETHNFVTAGGVVHNCRPPGNRDPLPDEIDSCRPYLEAQLDIVDPKVVLTLGNFATKLLLKTNEGINRVRGRAYPFRRGWLVPTYHPAAVLRSGGESVARMRADLVRAKQLLKGVASEESSRRATSEAPTLFGGDPGGPAPRRLA
ncbi:MAG TPA: uracil-DNA glycosylase family protein [Acidimicrobiales bacterium]|nr:uracil-DNA glycosylase family protein [Acidimicrobiales bacterium]